MSEKSPEPSLVHLSSLKFLAGCAVLSALIVFFGASAPLPPTLVAAEVLLTVTGLFLFGSFKYRLDKNALTYGMLTVISATFWTSWWPTSALRAQMSLDSGAIWTFIREKFLSFHGLEELVHLDTMLFILGLTFFVAVISQTRLLESICFRILNRFKGAMLPTVALITAIVSFTSGILDGVSMIGLMIRILVILLFLSRIDDMEVIYFVVVSTVVTTVCGMWLAYGEPPNLIMKTNLRPHLTDGFFLRYCAPMAVASWVVLFFSFRKKLAGRVINPEQIDFFEANTADLRFLQVSRHGEVLTGIEFVEERRLEFGDRHDEVVRLLHEGSSLGEAMTEAGLEPALRRKILAEYATEEIAGDADEYFEARKSGDGARTDRIASRLHEALAPVRLQRTRAQKGGAFAFLPFVALLVAHAINHDIPLFVSSVTGFAVAFLAIRKIPKMRALALREGVHEYREYLFLFPLFFSIALLTRTGFFDQLSGLIHTGIESLGAVGVAMIQFLGATFLSAILDNNVVADFASRALLGLPETLMHLFAMAQIAGYALGGCWTHIGSAQSVVSFAFIQKDIRPGFTPVAWIRMMTPIVLKIMVAAAAIIIAESFLLDYLH